MKRLFRILSLSLFCLSSSAIAAEKSNISLEDLPKLSNDVQHPVSCKRIFRSLTEYHYNKNKVIDDTFVSEFYIQYLKNLDSYKSLFYKKEVEEFLSNIGNVRASLIKCDLNLPYKIFNRYLVHKFDQLKFQISLLEKNELDLTENEYFIYDREESDWPLDDSQRVDLWKKITKYDLIKLILSGKTKEEASKRLTKRYKSNLNFLIQAQSEDVFSIYENTLATRYDPHTRYMSPAASEDFYNDMRLSLEGIGATLSSEEDTVTIIELIPGGPAEKSGLLKPKDKIIGVGKSESKIIDLVGMRLDEAVRLIRGPKGSEVYLQVQRGEGESSKIFVIKLIRDKIKMADRAASSEIKTVNGKKIGILKVSSFYQNLTVDAKKELKKLNDEKIDALVVDLRENGGGLITEAAGLSGLFFEKGPVVQVKYGASEIESVKDPDPEVQYKGPLVVLIDRLSASASEIFSAAMQDYDRGLIVGSNSFGKGTVQQVGNLSKFYDLFSKELGSLSYTIAKFYRVNGGSTQLKGVAPDIAIDNIIDYQKYGEEELPTALPWDSISPTSFTSSKVGIKKFIPILKEKYDLRVKEDPMFKITREQIDLTKSLMENKTVSLNLNERKEKQKQEQAKELERINKQLEIIGKPKVDKVADVPADVKFPDFGLDQSIAIAADFAELLLSEKN